MATSQVKLPLGFELESTSASGVKLPPGFELEKPVSAAAATSERKGFIERGLGDVTDTFKGLGDLFHPEPKTDIEKGLATSGNPLALPLHRAIVGYYNSTKQSIGRAEEAGENGDKTGVLINSAAAGLPLVGPLVSGVYEQSGKGDVSGDIGLAASRVIQALSMAPEGSVLPNPVAGVARAAGAAVESPAVAKLASTAKVLAKPAFKMGLEAAADVPVVRGLIKGAKTFKDVPAQLREIWAKDSPRAPHLQTAIENLATELETKAATQPEAPATLPKARTGLAEVREDAAIADSVRAQVDSENRRAFREQRLELEARNSMDKPKWLRQAEAKAAQVMADAEAKASTPTKYTKTVTPKPKMTPAMAQSKYKFLQQKSEAGQPLNASDQSFLQDFETTKEAVSSLEDLLRQSIEQVKVKKVGK